jgi:hypothetical protein
MPARHSECHDDKPPEEKPATAEAAAEGRAARRQLRGVGAGCAVGQPARERDAGPRAAVGTARAALGLARWGCVTMWGLVLTSPPITHKGGRPLRYDGGSYTNPFREGANHDGTLGRAAVDARPHQCRARRPVGHSALPSSAVGFCSRFADAAISRSRARKCSRHTSTRCGTGRAAPRATRTRLGVSERSRPKPVMRPSGPTSTVSAAPKRLCCFAISRPLLFLDAGGAFGFLPCRPGRRTAQEFGREVPPRESCKHPVLGRNRQHIWPLGHRRGRNPAGRCSRLHRAAQQFNGSGFLHHAHSLAC